MSEPPRIRILLADDHALFRKGMASLLSEQQEFEVVGEAVNGRQAVEMARVLLPDVVLMDLSMPEMDGLAATRQVTAELPGIRVVMLTIEDGDRNLFEAVKSGAQGYVLKKVEPQALFETLRGVAQGEAAISGVMAAKLMAEFSRQAGRSEPPTGQGSELTPREREVLGLVAHGKSNKEIAAEMAVAENTVKNHLKSILDKLHLDNRVQVATYALREGLTGKDGEAGGKRGGRR
jgi:DNA-binding NarL/FixJ family response regulator